MPGNVITAFFLSFTGGVIFILLLRKVVVRFRVLTLRQIPLIGGTAIWISFSIACVYILQVHRLLSREIGGILSASFLMLAFGIIDDWKELSIAAKFLFQCIVTVLLIFFGVKTQIVHIGPIANILITMVWIIGITNAFNHIDIMDGLAAVVAILISLSFFSVALLNGDSQIQLLAIALTGSMVSFLMFNLSPAKIYMGNSGSHFLGFVLASVALLVHYAPAERPIALLSPVLILGFLIFDTMFLVIMRIGKKILPFKKSNDHVALRLLSLGYSKQKTLLLMLLLCSCFSFCGILVSQVSTKAAAIIISGSVVSSVYLMLRMSKIEVHD